MRLGEVAIKITKGTTPTSVGCQFETQGINYIKSESITSSRTLDRSKYAFISEETHEKLKRSQIEENDILFSMAGVYLGKTAIVEQLDVPANTNQAVAIIRLDKEKADYNYVYYWLNNKSVQSYVNNSVAQSAQPNINLQLIGDLEISLPSLPTQRAIAATLSALDDKIAVNNKLNHILEQMAQTIFTELCSKGENAVLSDILTVLYGKDHKRLGSGEIPCYGSGGIMRYVDEAIYIGESVLIPRKGSLNNVLYVNEPFWTVDTMFYTHMTSLGVAKFVYFTVRNLDLVGMNVGSAVPSMTTAILNALEIVLPSDDNLTKFEEIVSPMFLKIKANNTESAHLAALRDTLLPMLMSGELKI